MASPGMFRNFMPAGFSVMPTILWWKLPFFLNRKRPLSSLFLLVLSNMPHRYFYGLPVRHLLRASEVHRLLLFPDLFHFYFHQTAAG